MTHLFSIDRLLAEPRTTASIFISCLLLFTGGCASTQDKTTKASNEPAAVATKATSQGMAKEAVLEHEDVKGKTPTVFQQPIEKAREAGLRALTFVGCKVEKNETYYLSGERPRKFGLLVGSGGETVEIFLYPKSDTETHVWVDTDLSFVGIAGQQGWDKQVIEEMQNILNKPSPAQAK